MTVASHKPQDKDALANAFRRKAAREREARQTAERLLEDKSLELFKVNESLLAAQARLEQTVSEIANERDRVVRMSKTDFLTQLPNRAAVLEKLRQDLKTHDQGDHEFDPETWLVLILLQRFKRINGVLGQIGGDRLIKAVGERIRSATDDTDMAARFSGTEFALILSGGKAKLKATLDRVSRALEKPFMVDGKEITVEYALAAAGSKLAGSDVDQMRAAVDSTISRSRRCGSGNVEIYDETICNELREREDMERALKDAIGRDEIVPWFQPIVMSRDSRSICLEALARWPTGGVLVSPDKFLPIARDLGLWEELNEHLFATACTQAKPWVESGHVGDLSFNISPAQLVRSNFVMRLQALLERTGFPPDHLILEITENVLIENPTFAAEQMHDLHALGIKIAVDDFGTGYSNLGSLIGLPIDAVKIDRSLVWEMEHDNRAAMLIGTLVQWARAINVSVVAEGVETETQALLLRALGCDRLQGYLFGRAMSAKNIETRMPELLSFVGAENAAAIVA
ncbi:MAG: bifunctional diguanylate cyclase/phosphodiesterase [Hyphomonadaceae bacterium]